MLTLSRESIKNREAWQNIGVSLPRFDVETLCEKSKQNTVWAHIGEGNIFRSFLAPVMQSLVEQGLSESGIAVASTFESETIDLAYRPFDNLCLQVLMHSNGQLSKNVIGSVTESLKSFEADDWKRLCEIFENETLQIVSFTITEKGYSIKNSDGEFTATVARDMKEGLSHPKSSMAVVSALLHARFLAGAYPVALVSMDNFSHNGDRLKASVLAIINEWHKNGLVSDEFVNYVTSGEKVSFPWSMIDKITPRPSEAVAEELKNSGFGSADIYITNMKTYIAPFVNAEVPQYLVIEDLFPNGRPPMEQAGVYFADKQTVDLVERMKVCTCLNPLHTALAVFGCILGYTSISDEMKDPTLAGLVKKIGYDEGMPVVVNPGIISPSDFIREVLEERFSNPYIPDTPQRIATDTSQKIHIRFGETVKLYIKRDDLEVTNLKYIPIVFAGWCRYLLGIDDYGNEITLSPDPLIDELKGYLSSIKFGDISSVGNNLVPVLSNKNIFGVDLYEVGLGEKVECYFKQMISGTGMVKKLLEKEVGDVE